MTFARSRKHELVLDCTNRSSVVGNVDFERYLAAQQRQLDEDFCPEWGLNARIACSDLETVPTDAWDLVVLDDSDQADALGYHDDVKGPKGMPLGKVFARSDQGAGLNWTVTASHEAMEMLPDPDCNQVVMVDGAVFGGRGLVLVARESCDACESDQFAKAFHIGGKVHGVDVMLSDFVTRAWFEDAQGAAVDAYGHLSRPWEIGVGGYIGLFVPGHGWTEAFHNQTLGDAREVAGPGKGMLRRRVAEAHDTRHPDIANSPRRLARFARPVPTS
jgi:hypothetical protein